MDSIILVSKHPLYLKHLMYDFLVFITGLIQPQMKYLSELQVQVDIYECYIHSTIFQVNQVYEIIRRPPTHMHLLKWVIPWSAYGWGGNLKCKVINNTGC